MSGNLGPGCRYLGRRRTRPSRIEAGQRRRRLRPRRYRSRRTAAPGGTAWSARGDEARSERGSPSGARWGSGPVAWTRCSCRNRGTSRPQAERRSAIALCGGFLLVSTSRVNGVCGCRASITSGKLERSEPDGPEHPQMAVSVSSTPGEADLALEPIATRTSSAPHYAPRAAWRSIARDMARKMNRCAGTIAYQYNRPHTPCGCQ